ncbi:MAG: HXXEE domain-containing protein [Acidobacteria bacterium]|nr:HXXEE domain-containing protein [Acidobacteriota bacterium]
MPTGNTGISERILPRLWLFPLTYIVHFAEEYFCGETFPVWLAKLRGIELGLKDFIILNAIAWLVMALSSWAASRWAAAKWAIPALGFVVAFNGALHATGSVVTLSYSPGLISGLLLWLPLGIHAVSRGWRSLSRRQFWTGITAGVAAHAIVSLAALK